MDGPPINVETGAFRVILTRLRITSHLKNTAHETLFSLSGFLSLLDLPCGISPKTPSAPWNTTADLALDLDTNMADAVALPPQGCQRVLCSTCVARWFTRGNQCGLPAAWHHVVVPSGERGPREDPTVKLNVCSTDVIWTGGGGGIIERRTWDNDLVLWSYTLNDSTVPTSTTTSM